MKITKLYFLFIVLATCLFLGGCSNKTPYIGENGNWWIGSSDLGIPAQGPAGEDGDPISVVSIVKTSSEGLVDTYTINFSDGNTGSFTVTNGVDGAAIKIISVEKSNSVGLVDTYHINFSDGTSHSFIVTNGTNGESVTIKSIEKTNTMGLVDTYTIEFSDGTLTLFTVTNGRDGETPYIGLNGNWWVGDVDTGVFADYARDDREITAGLYFVATTVKGKAGMIVSDYDGTTNDVNIPNYVGSVPVIGISSDAFQDNTNIESVSFSKNTIFLGSSAFRGCLNLKNIDFNKCEIEEIPNYAFYLTNVTSITLPETVTKLGNYSFCETLLSELNYGNITYFGEGCLTGYMGNYIYLTKEVHYVGSYAFSNCYVYIEHDKIPANWGESIAGTNVLSKDITLSSYKNDSYVYSKNESENTISVNHYIGNDERIIIPSSIDGLPVTKIGYGFNSITPRKYLMLFERGVVTQKDLSTLERYNVLTEVVIPNTVTKIEYGSFSCYGTLIYIPSSVNTMWYGVGYFNYEGFCSSFLVFENSFYPTIKTGFLDSSESYSEAEWLNRYGSHIRIALGVDHSKLEYCEDNKTFYYNESLGYAVFAVMDLKSKILKVAANFNGKTATTIRPFAVANLPQVENVRIESGITIIQAKAFHNIDLITVLIPISVVTINAYGFNDCCEFFFVEEASKPLDWDSYWAGGGSSYQVTYSSNINRLVANYYYYQISSSGITLTGYFGKSSTIYIPRTIEGIKVVKIENNFYKNSGSVTVYIPNTVTIISEEAFYVQSSSLKCTFYCEAASKPEAWSPNFCYHFYLSSYANHNTIFGQTLDY